MRSQNKTNPFIVIIAGGRHFNMYSLLERKCAKILQKISRPIVIRSGKATGADKLGERFAKQHKHGVQEFPADWKRGYKGKGTYDASAGYKRNKDMATGDERYPQQADALIAFWDGKSSGTKQMIDLAHKNGLKVRVIRYDKYEEE